MVRIALDKADGQLKSGMFAKGSLRFLQKEKALFINKSAVLELNGKQYAFVLGEDKKAHRKAIQPGIRNAEETEIISGLKAGDKVRKFRNPGDCIGQVTVVGSTKAECEEHVARILGALDITAN